MTYTTTYTAPPEAGTYTHPACPPLLTSSKTYTQTYTTYTPMDLHAREGLLIDPLVWSGAQGRGTWVQSSKINNSAAADAFAQHRMLSSSMGLAVPSLGQSCPQIVHCEPPLATRP